MVNTTKLYSRQTEVQVMAAFLFEPYIYHYVQDMLSRELFSDYDCQKVYDIIQQLLKDGKEIDVMEIEPRLRKENVEIARFLCEGGSASELTKQRIYFLQDLAIRRRLANLFFKGESLVSDPTVTIEDVQHLFKEFDLVFNNQHSAEVQKFGDIVKSLMNDVADRKADKGETGMMTGLRVFDSRFGWHGGDLIIIAGATSMGKSTIATTIAANMAVNNIPVAYYSMEMSAKQLTSRIIARTTEVSSSTTLYAKLSDDEYNKVYDGAISMSHLPIYFDERSKTSFSQICNSVRRLVKRYKVRVVFIDYLQILANGRGDNREQLLGDMTRDLKRLAVETDTAIVALSQLNRSGDLRGSGQIEEACDIMAEIKRNETQKDQATIKVKKGRNIGLGKEKLRFNSNLSYFCDYEQGDPDAPYEEKKEKLPF